MHDGLAVTSSAATPLNGSVLDIENLTVVIERAAATLVAVDSVSLRVPPGEIIGVVGESGSGKTMTALSVLRLVEPPIRIAGGAIRFEGTDLAKLPGEELRRLRGSRISMVFQEPMTSLDPSFTIGSQLTESAQAHGMAKGDAHDRAQQMLERVGIDNATRRMNEYPHQFSGGMRQRAMIALALQMRPAVLLADEPTTALDVTLQAQILDLLASLQAEMGMSVVLITHDLGVVAQVAQRLAVMYAGQIVEEGPTAHLLASPRHPYTAGLIECIRSRGSQRSRLHVIPGRVPDLWAMPPGCRFHPRCPRALERCASERPDAVDTGEGRQLRCFNPCA